MMHNYMFNTYNLKKYHHADNSNGSPRNFLAYLIKGQAKIVTPNASLQIGEGDVFYIPKNLCYKSYWYGDDEIYFKSFGFNELGTNQDTKFGLQIISADSQIKQKIGCIPTNGDNVDCKTLSLFYDAMSDIIPLMTISVSGKEELIAEKIKYCIQKNPCTSNHDIARLCMISEPYLYALFKKFTHMTPNTYRQKVLCDKGIELLLTTDKKTDEIANILNFSSSSYFRKVLKKQTGKTPREIRKSRVF